MKKKIIIGITIIGFILIIAGFGFSTLSKSKISKPDTDKDTINLSKVKEKYQPYVKSTKEVTLYKNVNGKYEKIKGVDKDDQIS